MNRKESGHRIDFTLLVRTFCAVAYAVSVASLVLRVFPPERGFDFGIHLALFLALCAQGAALVLVLAGAGVAALRRGFRFRRLDWGLMALAVMGMTVQFLVIGALRVDGSSVP